MQRGPFQNQCQRPAAHVSGHDFQRIDVHLNLLPLIDRVKMRRRMVAVKHANDDPVETAEFRHGDRLLDFNQLASVPHLDVARAGKRQGAAAPEPARSCARENAADFS